MRSSPRYILVRLAQAIPTMAVVLCGSWLLIHLAPGDPARIIAGDFAPREYLERVRHDYGLDRPPLEQFTEYIGRLLRGDFGYSFYYGRPVLDVVLARVGPTVLLVGLAQALAAVGGIYLGVYTARRQGTAADRGISVFVSLLYAMPVFWIALVLLWLFALELPLFPTSGMRNLRTTPTGLAGVGDVLRHAVLPVVSLTAYYLPPVLRVTRASVLSIVEEDFIQKTARGVGLSLKSIYYRHALKNAILPVVTLIGLSLGYAVTGAVLTEQVFGWPGMGTLIFEAISNRDYPVVMATFMMTSAMVLLASLLTDVLYAYLDPRIRYS